jgi:hypothetical protein
MRKIAAYPYVYLILLDADFNEIDAVLYYSV